MSLSSHSIYPELFRARLDTSWSSLGREGYFLGILGALEQFQREIKEQDAVEGILEVTQHYLANLNLFEALGFYLVQPGELFFHQVSCHPVSEKARLDFFVQEEIDTGKFAWALRQSEAVFFKTSREEETFRGMFHSLRASSCVVGMFAGVLRQERIIGQEIPFRVLSLFLGMSAYALAEARGGES